MLDGLVVVARVTEGHAQLVVGLSQQAVVGREVLQLEGQAVLEVLQGLGVVTCRGQVSGEKVKSLNGTRLPATAEHLKSAFI